VRGFGRVLADAALRAEAIRGRAYYPHFEVGSESDPMPTDAISIRIIVQLLLQLFGFWLWKILLTHGCRDQNEYCLLFGM
jgi:hypothetical protein